jgi:protein phosphatase
VSADHIPNVEIVSHQLLPGDRLLFATDGLTDVVDEEHLCWPLTHIGDPQFAANLLVSEALENNARDNITCVVVHYHRRRKLPRTQELPPFEFGSTGF